MTASANALPRGAIPSLDGIRAIAVLLVVLAHSGLENLVPGGFGVTIFFVLSGYLITTLMRIEQTQTGTLNLLHFYLRRLLRLMPPLLIAIAGAGLLAHWGWIQGEFTTLGLCSVLLYFSNYYAIVHDFQGLPHGIGVTWSLAVEEHYYFLYPPLALLALKLPSVNVLWGRKQATVLLVVLCGLILLWRVVLFKSGADDRYLTMATDARIDAILVGCGLALWRNPWLDSVPKPNMVRDSSIFIACLLILLGTLIFRNEFFRATLRYTIQSLAVAPLLYLAVTRADQLPFRWLNARPVVYIGTISYSIYLLHHVLMGLVAVQWPQLGWLPSLLVSMGMTLILAEPMRRWVEQPCARLRKRLHDGMSVNSPEHKNDAANSKHAGSESDSPQNLQAPSQPESSASVDSKLPTHGKPSSFSDGEAAISP